MTVKVVSGVGKGHELLTSSVHNQRVQQGYNPAVQVSNVHAANRAVQFDATVVCLRCSRTHPSTERVRDSGQAKALAQDIAERIEREDGGFEVHGKLNPTDSHRHLAE